MGIEKSGLQLGKNIIAWSKSGGKNLLGMKPVKIDTTAGLKLAPQLETDIVETQTAKKGFCHELWGRMFKDGNIYSAGTPTRVEHHANLHSFNGMLNNTSLINLNRPLKPAYLNEPHPTIAEAIESTDVDFKALSPITENLTVYRCIPKRPPFMKQENRLFEKAANLKPGEATVMREYAYCTPDMPYAKSFLNEEGVMYEISLPKGSRISQGTYDYGFRDYVLPRYSRFKCISNETLEDGSHKIKLEYILPDESWKI